MTIEETQNELLDELGLFPDWTERYEYVIDLGRRLPSMAAEFKTDDRLIQGCQSRVWLRGDCREGVVYFEADSDSVITKGLIALFVRVLSGHSAEDIVRADVFFPEKAGLAAHLAPTRANALHLMEKQMKQYALGCVGE